MKRQCVGVVSRWAFIGFSVMLIGCQTTTNLKMGEPPAGIKKPEVPKVRVGCVVKMNCPDLMSGQEESVFRGVNATNYTYQLRPMLEKALDESLYRAFEPPRGDILGAFTLEVEVFQSRLATNGSRATYFLHTQVFLRSPENKIIVKEDVEEHAESNFDGSSVPPAVWQAVYDIANRIVEKVANDPRTTIAAQKYRK